MSEYIIHSGPVVCGYIPDYDSAEAEWRKRYLNTDIGICGSIPSGYVEFLREYTKSNSIGVVTVFDEKARLDVEKLVYNMSGQVYYPSQTKILGTVVEQYADRVIWRNLSGEDVSTSKNEIVGLLELPSMNFSTESTSRLGIVSACPECGAPIYGAKSVPNLTFNERTFVGITSGRPTYGLGEPVFTCSCRYRREERYHREIFTRQESVPVKKDESCKRWWEWK